jgi:hypothetical protein
MEDVKLGATGRFPQGNLNRHDQGELACAIYAYQGRVIMNFSKPIAWLCLDYDGALALAEILRQRAAELAS